MTTIDEIKRRCEAAPPCLQIEAQAAHYALWHLCHRHYEVADIEACYRLEVDQAIAELGAMRKPILPPQEWYRPFHDFLAHSRTDIPLLIKALELACAIYNQPPDFWLWKAQEELK